MVLTVTRSLAEPLAKDELRVGDLWKAFRGRTGERIEVLRGVSFAVSAGEAVAITGPSGAGKSTLLHLLGGLERPDRGTIDLPSFMSRGEKSPTAAGPAGSRLFKSACRVGFVFQFHYLLPDLSAFENVALPLTIARFSRADSERRARLCLEEMGLGDRLNQRIGDLSGGEQQRVAVARALISKPGLVLADEPTGNLDTASGREIGGLLLNYCRRQRALLVIATHHEELARRCDRVLSLREGGLKSAEHY